MAAEHDDVVAVLNLLIEVCKDRESGYRAAAGGVRNPELKALFHGYERQSADYATELQAEVRRLGADPEQKGSLAGWFHRGWINIKAVVTGGEDAAVITECERGEDAALQNYQRALQTPLPDEVRAVVQKQYAGVKEGHDRLRAREVAAGSA